MRKRLKDINSAENMYLLTLAVRIGPPMMVIFMGVEFLMYGDDKRAPPEARLGDELALLRLYRECAPDDRQLLLRTARRLANGARREVEPETLET